MFFLKLSKVILNSATRNNKDSGVAGSVIRNVRRYIDMDVIRTSAQVVRSAGRRIIGQMGEDILVSKLLKLEESIEEHEGQDTRNKLMLRGIGNHQHPVEKRVRKDGRSESEYLVSASVCH